MNGLDSLRWLGITLSIKKNTSLKDLTALSHLDSIHGNMEIWDNDSLTHLTGLDHLRTIGSNFSIFDNDTLTDISALANVQFAGANLWIINNPLLDACAIYPVCNHLFQRPDALDISDNGLGCGSPAEVELACGGLPVVATVRLDNNGDCQANSTDTWVEGVLVRLSGSVQQGLRPTQSDGAAQFGYLGNSTFSLTLPNFPTQNWAICQDTLWLQSNTIQDTIRANFLLKPLFPCPDVSVDLWLPPVFRGCLVQ